MLQQLLDFLSPRPNPAPVADGRVVLAALLVRAARADGHDDPRQLDAVLRCLERRYDLSPAQALALKEQGVQLEAATGDTVHLTRHIKDEVALDDRPALLEDLWQIILADGERHENENGMMRLVSNLLGMNDRASALARQAVTERLNQS